MRVAFIGTVLFSLPALEELVALKADLVAVLTRGDRGPHADYADLGPTCQKYGLECKRTADINGEEIRTYLKSKAPDYLFCWGWSQLLRGEVLRIPKYGAIGFHPALVPQNRGRHPLIWALALGLEKTGSTFFFMDEGVDTGDILSQREVPIEYEDDAASLYRKVTETALGQIHEFWPLLKHRSYSRQQQRPVSSNLWRKRSKKDGEIDWRMSSSSIYNLVRALARPYPGAHFISRDQEIKVWKAREAVSDDAKNLEPGKILKIFPDETFLVKAGENGVHVLEYEPKELFFQEGEYLQ